MIKVVKTETRRNGKGNVTVERIGLARNSSTIVNGSSVENICPVGNSSQAGNTVSLTANRKYKDMVFRMLFSDKHRLLKLYNTVSGRHYVNPDELQIVTLENAVYMGMKNDMAFLLDTGIYLYEH